MTPTAAGWLPEQDGHRVSWAEYGNPQGPAALFVHGGPGGGWHPADARFFDLDVWRVIFFDQRGCGRSQPTAELSANTTGHLVADMERLRATLQIERWTLFGGSWGATLSLAYAQAHPGACASLILRGVFLATIPEIAWLSYGPAMFHPDAARRLAAVVGPLEPDLVAQVRDRLVASQGDEQVAVAAAWCRFEAAASTLVTNAALMAFVASPEVAWPMARIELEYLANRAYLGPDELLENAGRIAHVPCTIVHGRHDLICPLGLGADRLHQALPGSELIVVEAAGHSTGESLLEEALRSAVARHVQHNTRCGPQGDSRNRHVLPADPQG